MALYLVSVPLGNPEDITFRAQRILRESEILIVEELKPARKLLKELGLPLREMIQLNEHSTVEDLNELIEFCRNNAVALISDCGTPAFCDPGSQLVDLCRQRNIYVTAVPGPASLTNFISLSGVKLEEFYFRGFLPANSEDREKELRRIAGASVPIVLMDTPYRLQKLLTEIEVNLANPRIRLGINLTMDSEKFFVGSCREVKAQLEETKAEFVLLVEPKKSSPLLGRTGTPRQIRSPRGGMPHRGRRPK